MSCMISLNNKKQKGAPIMMLPFVLIVAR